MFANEFRFVKDYSFFLNRIRVSNTQRADFRRNKSCTLFSLEQEILLLLFLLLKSNSFRFSSYITWVILYKEDISSTFLDIILVIRKVLFLITFFLINVLMSLEAENNFHNVYKTPIN